MRARFHPESIPHPGPGTTYPRLSGPADAGSRQPLPTPKRLRRCCSVCLSGSAIVAGGPQHARPRPALAAAPGGTRDHRRAGSPRAGVRRVRGSPTVPRMNNDPALISQARQQFYNGKVSPTYSEPSIPWHNGHTKSVNNRLRTERRNRNHWTNLRQAPVMKPLQPPHHHRHAHSTLGYLPRPSTCPKQADHQPAALRNQLKSR